MNIGRKQNRIKRILALLLAVVLCTGDVTAPFGSLSVYAGEETEPSTVTEETAAQMEPLAVSEPETAAKQPETQPAPETQAAPET